MCTQSGTNDRPAAALVESVLAIRLFLAWAGRSCGVLIRAMPADALAIADVMTAVQRNRAASSSHARERIHPKKGRPVEEFALSRGQLVVRACLFLFAAIGISGGLLQMYLGQPVTTPQLDNVHRFMAGVYLSTGIICLWAGVTVRQQDTLVYLLALGVLCAGVGRLVHCVNELAPAESAAMGRRIST